jgi:acyl-CoA dehydrogenase
MVRNGGHQVPGDPRCKIIIFMAVTNPDAAKHQRHSMMLVPMESEV